MSGLHRRAARKARKPHVCLLCGDAIAAGERYSHRSGIGDDGPYSWAAHEACDELDDIVREPWETEVYQGETYEAAVEIVGRSNVGIMPRRDVVVAALVIEKGRKP